MKQCRTCLQSLPLTDFYRHPTMADRLFSACKRCTCAAQLAKRKPETIDDRHRLEKRGRPAEVQAYILGVWPFVGPQGCMAPACMRTATIAMLILQLGSPPIAIRLCSECHKEATAGCAEDRVVGRADAPDVRDYERRSEPQPKKPHPWHVRIGEQVKRAPACASRNARIEKQRGRTA
jgi:hypothetical protein